MDMTLTPEAFNALIMVTLGLSLLIGGWRFYMDMKRSPRPDNADALYLADMRRFHEQTSQQDAPRS
jgi:hypothetical protein